MSAEPADDLTEAIAIIRAIIYASDGCQGHAECVHSMEPWRQARRFLMRIDGEYYELPPPLPRELPS